MSPALESDPPRPPEAAYAAALLSLPKVGPARMRALLREEPASVMWGRLVAGEPVDIGGVSADTIREWRVAARRVDVTDTWTAIGNLGISVREPDDPGYPLRLRADVEPPQVLFGLGAPIEDAPSVAIVGTRTCTAYGRRVAHELGCSLARAGVRIVSGLAVGIDAAAHEGALAGGGARPIGVVGSGLDVVYPRRNRDLWHRVAGCGSLVSEAPPGTRPEPWRFPARNRIIAALSDAVVVVESHERGGSLHTVDEAQRRDIAVGAVPGPITSPASDGTNRLVVDGAVPITTLDDVLLLIGHVPPRSGPLTGTDDHGAADADDPLLDAIGWSPKLLEQLCLLVGGSAERVAADVERLVASGRCRRAGPWIERVA